MPSLGTVTAPPYDVIDGVQRAELLQRSPFNVVELDLPMASSEGSDRYMHAAETLEEWILTGILTQDRFPTMWALSQEFRGPDGHTHVRNGILARVRVTDYGAGMIRPHERTQPGPKLDRLELTRATRFNLSPIFSLTSRDAWPQIEPATANEPWAEVTDIEGTIHRLWPVADEAIHDAVTAKLEGAELLIADGHHRYETAINFRDEMRQKHPDAPANAAFNYCMTTLVSMDDPGLTILPTHREIHDYRQKSVEQVLADAQAYFEVTPVASREALAEAMAQATPADRRIGFYDGRYYLLRLADPQIMAKVVPDRAEEWRMLDVSILHELLIERVMGIDKARVEAKENLDYHRDLDLALQQVDEGRAQCLFILNPTRMSEVKACSDKGEKMPQKSTDFYPKVIAGLVALAVGLKERL